MVIMEIIDVGMAAARTISHQPTNMILQKNIAQTGHTLVEGIIAAGISALYLGSLFTMNASSMGTIKMARESSCASQVLQQRVESLRIANWHDVTDATWLRDNLLNADAAGTDQLKSVSETLLIEPYGSGTNGNTQLTRSGGVASIVNSVPLLAENAVKVTWTINYVGAPNARNNSRQTVAILAKGGVAKW
jgi:hypothetical protein